MQECCFWKEYANFIKDDLVTELTNRCKGYDAFRRRDPCIYRGGRKKRK